MKRFGLAAVVALALVVAACGSAAAAPAPPGRMAQVNLVLWMGYTPPPPPSQGAEYESLKSLVAEFTRQHPKIHIRWST